MPGDVVLVAVDSAAFEGLGRRQPIPRAVSRPRRPRPGPQRRLRGRARHHVRVADHAAGRRGARAGHPRVLGWRAEPRRAAGAAGFRQRAARARRRSAGPSSPRLPSVPVDDDGVIRRIAPLPPAVGGRQRADPGAGGGRTPARSRGPLASTTARVPRPARGGCRSRARARRGPSTTSVRPAASCTIPSDAVAALGDAGSDLAADNPLRGRLVLVGGTFPESRDYVPHAPRTDARRRGPRQRRLHAALRAASSGPRAGS